MQRAVGLLRRLKEAPWYGWVDRLVESSPVVVEEYEHEWQEPRDAPQSEDDDLPEMWRDY